MPVKLCKAPLPLLGWGFCLSLLPTPAPAQLLTGILNIDTRRMVVSDSAGAQGSLPTFDSPGGARLELDSRYDDVYHERGRGRRTDVSRWEQRAGVEVPFDDGRSRVRLTFSTQQTVLDSRPGADQGLKLGSDRQRLGVGYGRSLAGLISTLALAAEATRSEGDWYPGYSLGLAGKPLPMLRLTVTGGHRIDGRTATGHFEQLIFPGRTIFREDWYGLDALIKSKGRLELEAGWRQGVYQSAQDAAKTAQLWVSPELQRQSLYLGLQVRPGPRGLGGGVRWRWQVAEGTGELYDAGRLFGRITEARADERDWRLWLTHRRPESAVRVQFDRLRMTYHGKGRLEPWPFTDTIFSQLYTVYLSNGGEASLDRLELSYTRGPAGSRWDLRLGYILLRPASDLVWWQNLVFIPVGDIHRSELNLAAAELLVPTVSKTWRVGPAVATYSFTKIIPTRTRHRREPTPAEPGEKTRQHGGDYHRLKLTYGW